MGLAHSPSLVTDGLVLCLDAGNTKSYPGSGTAWSDLSGNGNNGTLTGGPTYSSANYGYISLDGTDDYINMGNAQSLNITNNASICQFVYFNTNYGRTGYQNLISKRVNGTLRTNYAINFNSTDNVFQLYYNTSGSFRLCQVTLNTNFPAPRWYYIVGTYAQSSTNTIMTLYKNGVSIGTATTADNLASVSANAQFGAFDGTTEPFSGRVGVMQIYNRTLSAAEVAQNFAALRGRYGI